MKDQISSYGNNEINELFSYWEAKIGYPVTSKVKQNRYSAQRLIKKYGLDRVKSLVDGVALTYNDPCAPRIADIVDIEYKLSKLLACGKRNSSNGETIEV